MYVVVARSSSFTWPVCGESRAKRKECRSSVESKCLTENTIPSQIELIYIPRDPRVRPVQPYEEKRHLVDISELFRSLS